MSRSRNIKPGFFKNDLLAECEPLARLLFAGLWCEADRAGRLEDRPKRLKAECLAYDDCDVDALLSQLASKGFIVRYVVDGVGYIAIPEFLKHQKPHLKESASTIPAPDKHLPRSVLAPEIPERAALIPDSLLLIPDSLKEQKHAPDGDLLAGISPEVAKDFKALRSKLRAPITATAMKGIQREAALAGVDLEAALVICCERGWRGFKAEWLRDARAGPPPNQPFGKTAQAISQLQAMKNELAQDRTADRIPEAALLGPGPNPR